MSVTDAIQFEAVTKPRKLLFFGIASIEFALQNSFYKASPKTLKRQKSD